MLILMLILLAVIVLVAVMVGGWGGVGDRVVRRRTIVRRPATRVVEEPMVTRRVVEEPVTRRRVYEDDTI
jgi:hypothetical protein